MRSLPELAREAARAAESADAEHQLETITGGALLWAVDAASAEQLALRCELQTRAGLLASVVVRYELLSNRTVGDAHVAVSVTPVPAGAAEVAWRVARWALARCGLLDTLRAPLRAGDIAPAVQRAAALLLGVVELHAAVQALCSRFEVVLTERPAEAVLACVAADERSARRAGVRFVVAPGGACPVRAELEVHAGKVRPPRYLDGARRLLLTLLRPARPATD